MYVRRTEAEMISYAKQREQAKRRLCLILSDLLNRLFLIIARDSIDAKREVVRRDQEILGRLHQSCEESIMLYSAVWNLSYNDRIKRF